MYLVTCCNTFLNISFILKRVTGSARSYFEGLTAVAVSLQQEPQHREDGDGKQPIFIPNTSKQGPDSAVIDGETIVTVFNAGLLRVRGQVLKVETCSVT